MMVEYYRQRASAGLIIAEATGITREGLGWPSAPGIWSEQQTVKAPGNYSCCQSNVETETWCRGTDDAPTPGQYGPRYWMHCPSDPDA
jgi:hypothetical protein